MFDASHAAATAHLTAESQHLLTPFATMLSEARRCRATDIHFDPVATHIRFRVDGALRDASLPSNLPIELVLPLVKTLCGIKPGDPKTPKEASGSISYAGQRFEFHAAIFPILSGERLTLHLLPEPIEALTLDQLRLSPAEIIQLQQLTDVSRGLLVLAGPESTSKTNLLYTMLLHIDRVGRSVMTLEDPVGAPLPGVCQTAVHSSVGLTWKHALRHILMQDPDVLAVAPPPHHRSFPQLFTAAQDGRLLMLQLSTGSGADTLRHLLDAGLPAFQICDSLRAVVAQRTVRVLCPECKAVETPDLKTMTPAAAMFTENLSHASFFRPVGCARCRHTGFESSLPLLEILIMNDPLRDLIATNPTRSTLRTATAIEGLSPLAHNAILKASLGLTSLDEIRRTFPPNSV